MNYTDEVTEVARAKKNKAEEEALAKKNKAAEEALAMKKKAAEEALAMKKKAAEEALAMKKKAAEEAAAIVENPPVVEMTAKDVRIKNNLGGDTLSVIRTALELRLPAYLQKEQSLHPNRLISGTALEDLVEASFVDSELRIHYKTGSHKSGSDTWLANYSDGLGGQCGISIKTGKIINKRDELKFSGFRTTTHEILSMKLSFFEKNSSSFYVFCVPPYGITDDKIRGYDIIDYKIIVVEGTEISYGNENDWDTTTDPDCWKMSKGNIKAEISMNMSAQLWTTFLDISKFSTQTIRVHRTRLGKVLMNKTLVEKMA